MSYHIYPVLLSPYECNDYRVRVNSKDVTLNTARVSAVPFNRRWPGHQRQIEQSEIIQFLSLATDEPLTFEITPTEPFESVKIRPQSLGIIPKIENGTISFTLNKPAYFTVEPYGRNKALHIFADPICNYGVDASSPDVIYFGPGEHDVGILDLHSNQTVFIDEGATVYGCIHAKDAENIKIIGKGILDNSKNVEKILFEANANDNFAAVNNAERIFTVELQYCTNIEIEGITIRDSLVYNIRPIACKNFNVHNVKIIGCWRYNSDGIDMHNCDGVHIFDCFIRTYDDSICVKGFDCFFDDDNIEEAVHNAMYRDGKSYDVFKNVLVENCVIWNDWGKCLEIGAETKAEEIFDITFRDCELIHTSFVALDCMNIDYAHVHDVTFKNITVDCDEIIPEPIIQKNDEEKYSSASSEYMSTTIKVSVEYHPEYSVGSESRRGKNSGFLFENIRVLGDKLPLINCSGYDSEHMTEDVLIKGLKLGDTEIKTLDGERFTVNTYCKNIHIE